MTEFGAKIHDPGTFFDAPTEDFLVLTYLFRFRTAAKLLGQIYVFDAQKAEIHVTIKRLGAYHFRTGKRAVFHGLSVTGIQRPPIVALETIHYVLKKAGRGKTPVSLSAASSVFQIHLFAFVRLVTLNLAVIKRHRPAPDLVFDGIVGPFQLLGNAVD